MVKDAREARHAAAQQSEDHGHGRLICEAAMGNKPEEDAQTGTFKKEIF